MVLANRVFYTLLFFLSTLVVQGQSSIDLDVEDQLISDLLIDVALHFKQDIVFNETYFDGQSISLKKDNLSLKAALSYILRDQDVEYKVTSTGIQILKYLEIHGYVIDSLTKEKLIGAHILENKYGRGGWTNEEGFFSMKVPAETSQLRSSYIGYEDKEYSFSNMSNNIKEPIILLLSPNESVETVVISSNTLRDAPINMLRGQDILKAEINALVASGGEPDIMQYLYTQAGVATGPDGIGGLHVRGGLVDQNLFLLDGATLFNPSHSLGLHSVFNTNMIQVAEFKKSGFAGSEAGRTSSILDIRMIDGNMKEWKGNVSFSTLASGIMLNGPIVKDKLSLVLGGRRTHIDPFIESITRDKKNEELIVGKTTFNFYDIYGKIQYKPNLSSKLTLSVYKGSDYYQDDSDDTEFYIDEQGFETGYDSYFYDSEYNWGNELVSLKFNKIFNSKLFTTTTIAYSKFNFNSYAYYDNTDEIYDIEEFNQTYQVSNFLSSISDKSIKHLFEIYPNDDHHITIGLNANERSYSPGIFNIEYGEIEGYDEEFFDDFFGGELDNYYKSTEYGVSFNDAVRIGGNSSLNLGANISSYRSEDLNFGDEANFVLWQANLKYIKKLNEQFSIQFAFDKMYQPLHVVSTSSIGFPNDLWVPATEKAIPQQSYQADLGISYTNKGTHIQINAYLKEQENLLQYNFVDSEGNPEVLLPSLLEITTQQWEEQSAIGSGRAMGLEIGLTHSRENLKYMINYAFADSQRQFDKINGGEKFPFEFNLKHTLSANFLYRIKSQWWLYSNWNYRSGMRQTLYESEFLYSAIQNQFANDLSQVSGTNGDTEKAYHRLDVGFNWSYQGRNLNHQLSVGVQNVYNQKNNYFSYLINDSVSPELNGRESKGALPILPNFTYRISF